MTKEFIWPVRVYYEDTDAGGVVYYANYLKFMERARTEWLRALGFEQDVLREQSSIIFAVRSVQMEYIKPARFNDELKVTLRVLELGRVSITVAQSVRHQTTDEELGAGMVKIVSLNEKVFKPVAIPQNILDKIRQGEYV